MTVVAGEGVSETERRGRSRETQGKGMQTLDVGGCVFQTTKQTLTLAGQESLLSRVGDSCEHGSPHFIDRDPAVFGIFLSLLRNGRLPSKAKAYDLRELVEEAKLYNIESLLNNELSSSSQFDAYNLEKTCVLPLNGRDLPSAISATENGALLVSHGSKITSFDWSLSKKSTILTQFTAIDSLSAMSQDLVAAGATDFSGLQLLDLEKGLVQETLYWGDGMKSSATVQAIGSSPIYLFTSFESARRNSSAIMVYDLQTLVPIMEIGHCEIFGAELDSAIPASKLKWVKSHGLLMASGSHRGPSGTAGEVKLLDVRTGKVVWELKERDDCFSDITVSDGLSAIFKVGVHSGEVFCIDLRKLATEKKKDCVWDCLGGMRQADGGKKKGLSSKIVAHEKQVFCTKGEDIEIWSEVCMDHFHKGDDRMHHNRVLKKNLLGGRKDVGGEKIINLAFGGNKMFVTRQDQQFIEVWHSCANR